MTKKILFVVGGAIASISFLVLMILDLILIKDVVYNDGWGTNFEMNSDYVAMFIISLAFLIYGIYSLLAKKYDTKLGTFLKAFFKALKKEEDFDYLGHQQYLFIGLAGIGFLIYSIYNLIKVFKKED